MTPAAQQHALRDAANTLDQATDGAPVPALMDECRGYRARRLRCIAAVPHCCAAPVTLAVQILSVMSDAFIITSVQDTDARICGRRCDDPRSDVPAAAHT